MKTLVLALHFGPALSAADSRIAAGMNAFTTAAYQKVAGTGDSNLILSPFNIGVALSMALAGARGQTAVEIAAVLHQGYDSSYDGALTGLVAPLGKTGNMGSNQLLMANALWVQEGCPILPAFHKTLTGQYHAPLKPLDFIRNAEGARGEINRWTEQHTRDSLL